MEILQCSDRLTIKGTVNITDMKVHNPQQERRAGEYKEEESAAQIDDNTPLKGLVQALGVSAEEKESKRIDCVELGVKYRGGNNSFKQVFFTSGEKLKPFYQMRTGERNEPRQQTDSSYKSVTHMFTEQRLCACVCVNPGRDDDEKYGFTLGRMKHVSRPESFIQAQAKWKEIKVEE